MMGLCLGLHLCRLHWRCRLEVWLRRDSAGFQYRFQMMLKRGVVRRPMLALILELICLRAEKVPSLLLVAMVLVPHSAP